MDNLSKEALIEAYIKAIDLGLTELFIKMISYEIDKRGITDDEITVFKETCLEKQKWFYEYYYSYIIIYSIR